jgi:2-dehydro-3-deoxygalactonokinase
MSGNALLADWGTSNLRLWLVDEAGTVLAHRASTQGADGLGPDGFAAVLQGHLQAMDMPVSPTPLPVVICGMAGARQGWREAGYVHVPATPNACLVKAVTVPAEGLDVRILPGLAQQAPQPSDVMRGEETQLIGLLATSPSLTGTVCLPGTHSKWVRTSHGQIQQFHTAMTGELFALLSRDSVLRHVIAGETRFAPEDPAFGRGLETSFTQPGTLPLTLFQIRAAGLLAGQTGASAAARLSGLLIGAELIAALAGLPETEEVALVAAGALAPLYAYAFTQAKRRFCLLDANTLTLAGLLAAARHLFPAVFKD